LVSKIKIWFPKTKIGFQKQSKIGFQNKNCIPKTKFNFTVSFLVIFRIDFKSWLKRTYIIHAKITTSTCILYQNVLFKMHLFHWKIDANFLQIKSGWRQRKMSGGTKRKN